METLKVTGKVKTGSNPDHILYDPASKYVFTFNGRGKDLTVVNPANGTVVRTLPMGGRPEQAVADVKGMIYDNISDTNEVAALDSCALTIKVR
jgi:DNA-binding beta-propeller fold protein YncE